jgi:hypothetical protein
MNENPIEPKDEIDYFDTKRNDRTYISKSFPSRDIVGNEDGRKIRILSKVFDSDELFEFAKIKKDIVLRTTRSRRQEVKVVFFEDSREIKELVFQRFTKESGNPHKYSFSFGGNEIKTIYNLLELIRYIDLEDGNKVKLDDIVMNESLLSEYEKRKFLSDNPDLVKEISEHHITTSDITAFAYRKNQLEIFEKMLKSPEFFEAQKFFWLANRDEAVWQKFFEQNPWIFGYGLNYIFTSQLDDKKLEQYTTGYSFHEAGKRTDALMKTRGIISSLCFIEIKTHKTHLLRKEPYRGECWPVSNELCGSIAQIQKTVQKAIKSIQTKIEFTSAEGNPTGEIAFLYQPKSFVVIGSLNEFVTNNAINEQMFGSFELFRRNVTNPEIITFDELYERAKFIIKLSEEESVENNEDQAILNKSSHFEDSEEETSF